MSPLIDGKNSLEKDGFFRNERGLREMTLLLSFMSMVTGISLIILGGWGFVKQIEGFLMLIQIGGGLVGASAGLQAWEAKLESNNLRN